MGLGATGTKAPGEGLPVVPWPLSPAFVCPTDPGIEATKGNEDGVRAPRDSEVGMVSSGWKFHLHAGPATALTPRHLTPPTGPRWSRGAWG